MIDVNLIDVNFILIDAGIIALSLSVISITRWLVKLSKRYDIGNVVCMGIQKTMEDMDAPRPSDFLTDVIHFNTSAPDIGDTFGRVVREDNFRRLRHHLLSIRGEQYAKSVNGHLSINENAIAKKVDECLRDLQLLETELTRFRKPDEFLVSDEIRETLKTRLKDIAAFNYELNKPQEAKHKHMSPAHISRMLG